MTTLQEIQLLEVRSKEELKCRFNSRVHAFPTIPGTLKEKHVLNAYGYDQVSDRIFRGTERKPDVEGKPWIRSQKLWVLILPLPNS